MAKHEVISFSNKANQVMNTEHGRVEMVQMAGGVVARLTLQKGWKWSVDLKPVAKTDLCGTTHFLYQVSGVMRVKLADGTEYDIKPGDMALIPPGHDAWVEGNTPVVCVDFYGASGYAKK